MHKKRIKTFIFKGLSIIKLYREAGGRKKVLYYMSEPGPNLKNSVVVRGRKFYLTRVPELRKRGFPGVPAVRKRNPRGTLPVSPPVVGLEPVEPLLLAKRA